MSFSRYEQYKDSGVEWLGEVPAHWGIGQSRRLFAQRKERALETDSQLTASQKHGVIYQRDFMELEGQKVVQVIYGADILKHVEPNDFVISMRSFQGGIEWCGLRGCISSAYVMLVPCDRIEAGFFRYLLKSSTYIQALQSTSNLVRDGQALRYENFTLVDLPLVPAHEQQAIAAFLDREIAKIDGLVKEQKCLIELLKEKRQAAISHAVTKGLSPNAPMKDSGAGWIGAMPTHWRVPALGYVSTIDSGSTPDRNRPEYWGGNIPWIKTGEVDYRPITEAEEFITEAGLDGSSARLAEPGTLLMAMYGQGVTRGRVAVLMVSAAYNQACAAIKFGPEVRIDFGRYFFMAAYAHIRDGGNETSQMNLGTSIIRKFKMTLPPPNEQGEIVTFLDYYVGQLDLLLSEAKDSVELLAERRTALISAAVTGKIDVRGRVNQEILEPA